MDKDNKQPPADKASDKKQAPPGGGNLVWYMLALGVLLLLMVTILGSGTNQSVGWSDLIKLVEATGDDGSGSVDAPDPNTTQGNRIRLSNLSDIKIGPSAVAAKVTRQRLK